MAAPPLDEEIVGRLAFPSRTSIPSQEQILADIERVEREMGMASIQSALEPRPAPPTENQQMAEQMWQERWGRTDTPEKIALRLGLGIGSGIGALEKAAGGVLEAPTPPLSLAGVIGRTTPVGAMLRRASRDIGGRLRERGKARAQEYGDIGTEVRSGPLGDIGQALTATAVASAPTIPAAALGGVPAAAVLAGTQSFGQTFSEAKDHYGNEQDALIPAVASGLVTGLATAGFGRTGIESLGAGLTRGTITSLLKEITKQAGYEAAEEGLDQVGQSIIAKLSYSPEMRLDEAINETLLATGAGALMGGAVRTGAETAGRAVEGARNIVEERQFQRASRDTARQTATMEADPRFGFSTVEKRNVFEQTPEQQSLDRLFPVGGETTTATIPPVEPPRQRTTEDGLLFASDKALYDSAKSGEQIRGSLLTDEASGDAEQKITTLEDGDQIEDVSGERYQVEKGSTGNITVMAGDTPAGGTTKGKADLNLINIVARGRIIRKLKQPSAAQPVAPRQPRQRPEVPSTPAEERKTVLQEIRDAQAMTIGQIQALFPKAQLTREQARVYRRMAWPEIQEAEPQIEATPSQESRPPVPATGTAKPKTLPTPLAPVAQTPEVNYGPWADKVREATQTGRIIPVAGVTWGMATGSRPVVFMRVGNTTLPFYRSSQGTGGDKKAGEWQPFFGFGNDVWMIKGTGTQIRTDYGSPEIAAARKWLNENFKWPHEWDLDLAYNAQRTPLNVAGKQGLVGRALRELFGGEGQFEGITPQSGAAEHIAATLQKIKPPTPAAQTLVPQAPPPQVVPPPVAPATLSVNDFTIQLGREFNSGNPNLDRIQQLADQLPNPEDAVRMSGSWMGLRGQTTGATGIMRGITVRGKPFWQWENEYQQAEDARAKAAPPPDAPQFPLKPLASGWVDARGLPVEMVPDTTHPSGNRWRVKAAQPQPVEETPKRPPAAAAPPKVSKLRERVATKKEPKGQIAKRIPKKPKPEVPVVETSPMEALMARIEAKEKATAPAVPKTTPVTPAPPPKVVIEKTEADVAPAPDNVMHDAGVRSGHEEWDSDKARRQAALGYGVIKGKWQKVTKELLSIVQADVRALNKRRLEHIARMKDYVERFGVKPTDDIDELTFRQQTGTSYDQQTIIEFVQRLETAIRSGNEYVRGLEKQLRRGERGFISGSKVEDWADEVIRKSPEKRNLGADPVLAVAGVIKGLAILERGVRDFAAWSAQMISELGDWVTPHLETLYARALELEADDRKLAAAENLLKIKMAGMVTAQVPAVQEAVAEIKAEILTRNQRGKAPILTGEALDRQRAFDAVAAHPLIRKQFIGPVERMQEVMTSTDGAFTTYREIKADPEATPQMQSAAAHIATKQLDGFYSELRRFQSSYQNKLEKLLEQVEKLNEAKAETAGESEVLNVLLEDFQTFGKEIAYQSRDIGAVRAYRRVLGQSGGVRNTLGFIARFLDIPAKPTREDLLKAIEEHAQPFINDDRAFEQVVGAARETVDMVVDYIIRSEPLRARLKAGKEMLEDKAVSGGRNVLAPFKAALAAAVRAGNVEQAISIYTSGAGKTATERAKTKKLADFFKQKERALLNEMWAMGIVKTYVDQVTTSPTFQDLAKEVYSDLNVRLVNRGTEGIEYVLDPIFDEKPTKLFLKPDGSLLEQNTLALKTYHDNALVYLSDPDAPGYDHRKAAGLQALLDDWAQFTNPFFNPGARKFVESLQTKTYRTIFGQLGRIDLIPQFVIDKAGGMAANLAHRTLNAFSTMQELKIAIMRAHDPKLLRLEMAAMKSHKMKGDVDGYRDKIYAPLEESLQYFENIHQLGVGSPIGNGHVITKEDMVYHEAVRAFEKDAMDTAGGVGKRAFQSIKANPGGILYTIDGQTYIRIPAETGPGTVHRRLGRVGGWVYDWEEARTPDQKRNFINKHADRLLFGYMLGVTNPKYRFTYRFADELRSIVADAKGGNPVASLEDLADRIMDKRVALTEDTEGDGEVVTLADVQSQILAEIDEMFKNYRKYNPTPKEGDKSVAWVFGGADSFNTERGNPIVPPLWYDYGSVSTSERLGYLHNMTAKFAIEHYNAMAALSQVMTRIVDDFETRARTDVDLSSKTNIKRERGEIFYSWGEAKHVAQDVTDYTRLLNEALIFSAKSPDIASGKLDPKSLVAPWMDVGVASALTGPSAMIMNMFGGGRSMALFDRTVRNKSTVGSLLRNGKKFVAGSLREATRLMAHEGNPVGKAIGELLNNARTKPLIGAAAQTFYDYLMATREMYSRAADEGLHLNVDLWNTIMTEWMWRESGGVATQAPSNVIARKIINPASTALRMFAEVVKQGGVGYVDSRLNVRAVRMEHDLEHDLKKRATLYGDMRLAAAQAQGYDPYDLTDPRNKFSAKELVGGRLPDSAALRLRQLLQSYGDINVDAVMMAFHRQWVEAGRPKDLSTMQMLSEPQRRQLTLAIAADNNLATWATRPLAVRTGRGAAAVGLFQGYPAWYMHKMAQYSERLTGKGWTRGQIESIPTMMAVAVIMTVVGSLGQGLVEEATRRLLNRQSRYPTIFDFNQSAKSYALTLLNGFFNQWAAVGDVGNAMIQRTFRRGFDFNSRMYYLNYVTSVVDTLKEYWQTGRVLRPTLRFLQRWLFPFNYIGPHLPILSGLNEMNQTRNALTSGAHQIGMEARLKAPFSAGDVTLTKSTGPLNDFMNAVGNRNMEGLLGAFTELVNVKREEGSADPVGAAIRAIQARNPVTQVFGAKPSPEEFQALFSVMRDDDVRRVKENLQFFDAAVQAIGGSPVSFTKEPGGGGGGGGGTGSSSSGSVGQGGIPAARRLPAPPRVSPGVFRSGGLNIGPAATFRLAIPRIRTSIGRLRGRSKVVRVKRGRRSGRLRGRMRSKVRLRV